MIAIIGTGRCGTGYAAAWLRAAGLDVGHETDGKDGRADWRMTLDLAGSEKYRHVIHLVRDPVACCSSLIQPRKALSIALVRGNLGYDLQKRPLLHWVTWNMICGLISGYHTLRIENLDAHHARAFFNVDKIPKELIPKDFNTRGFPNGKLTVDDLRKDPIFPVAQVLARKYGYKSLE